MWWNRQLIIFYMTVIFCLHLGAMGNQGEIRCYCNQPVCVATAYMCKSSQGVCFSEVSSQSDISKSRHGCVEQLHQLRHDVCQKRIRNARIHKGKTAPLIMCCSEDLCNYVDSMDIKIHINAKVNHSYNSAGMSSSMEEGEFFFGSPPDASSRQDLWFKAAVIAVPIAGGFILIMLILLAVHMLRKDNRRQRQIVELRRLRQFKAHLLVNDHFTEKNETNAKLNQKEKSNNMYKNVNIAISRDIYVNEKHFNYDLLHKPLNNAFCNAVVTWSSGLPDRKSSTQV